MSEEHKKPEDHAHDHAHDAHPAPEVAHDAPAEEAAAPAHISQEHPADPAISDHAEADAPGVEHPVAHAEDAHPVEEPGVHVEPSTHDVHPQSEPVEAAHEAAPLAAAPHAPEPEPAPVAEPKRPVWSDQGDAPFEDIDTTPVYARKKGGKSSSGSGNEFFEIIKTVGFALLIALVLRILLFQPFTIPSASMEPNLYEGDYIVVSKWAYGYSKHSVPFSPDIIDGRIMGKAPTRGDVVVFKLPRDNKTDYIKRVIGLPGDRVQMINNLLYINGTAVTDVVVGQGELNGTFGPENVIRIRETLPGGKSVNIQEFGPGFPLDSTEVFEVPVGHYFMMGDNRDNSEDSRSPTSGVGLVPAENLVGKAEIILFSWSPGASLFNPVSWFSKVRPSRFFTVLR